MPDKQDDTQNLSGTQPVSLPEWQPAPPDTAHPTAADADASTHAYAGQRTRTAGITAL